MTPLDTSNQLCVIRKTLNSNDPPGYIILLSHHPFHNYHIDKTPPLSFKTQVDAILTARDRGYAVVDTFPVIY